MGFVPATCNKRKTIVLNAIYLVCGITIGVSFVLFRKTKLTKNESHSFDEQPQVSAAVQTAVADKLTNQVRVLCFVVTTPKNHDKKAIHVLKTWGKRCNKILFTSESSHSILPILRVDVAFGRSHLTKKTMQTFDALYRDYIDDFEWFLKADDDTYVIVENLRYFLSAHSPNESVYFGHHFKPFLRQGYHGGGGGYAVSREALRRFGNRKPNTSSCQDDGGHEDVEFGRCMEALGVKTGFSLDNQNRSRFHHLNPSDIINGNYPQWYKEYDMYGARKGNISDYAISFHYVTPEQLYTLDFLVYHLRPYGIVHALQHLT